MGFVELAHTADWSVRVWGKDFNELLTEAARAMNTLAGVQASESSIVERAFVVDNADKESILISLLTELIYYQEHDNLSFSTFEIKVQDHQLDISMRGSKIINIDKVIKAVTWHNLKIEHTPRGYETEIVFDV